ncbi:10182_t:CDS:2 [Acaulospora morrowiae]|uniref:10182_t:CDS:1 n=1 Tax=Acaulospora morrowiae TaxID=94023 RepID=A0A9N8WG05_9GLOM|nr:10182_t:CDS:2 [Acaulospora morrowiae]
MFSYKLKPLSKPVHMNTFFGQKRNFCWDNQPIPRDFEKTFSSLREKLQEIEQLRSDVQQSSVQAASRCSELSGYFNELEKNTEIVGQHLEELNRLWKEEGKKNQDIIKDACHKLIKGFGIYGA